MENTTPSRCKQRALEIHPTKANCAQAIVAAYAPRFGIADPDTALALSTGLGRGVAGMNEMCGTILGVSVILGLAFGTAEAKREAPGRVFELTKAFAKEFQARNGSMICGVLLGITPPPAGVAIPKKRPCHDLVAEACDFLDRVLPPEPAAE